MEPQDTYWERALKALRSASYRLVPTRIRDNAVFADLERKALTLGDFNSWLSQRIEQGIPTLVGRPGGIEADVLSFFQRHRMNLGLAGANPYPRTLSDRARSNAGVAHHREWHLDQFSIEYLRAVLDSDAILYGLFSRRALPWAQTSIIGGRKASNHVNLQPLASLSEGLVPWTRTLEGKRVLVVHPFTESISRQYQCWRNITGIQNTLSDFELQVLSPPVTFAGEPAESTWFENLAETKSKMSMTDFDVAIIGAGAYGLPLAHHARELGKVGIHAAGDTQTFFGVFGHRWRNVVPTIHYVDDSWVRPRPNERPDGYRMVENGCYW